MIKLKDNDECKEGKAKWNKESMWESKPLIGLSLWKSNLFYEFLDFRVLKDEIDLGDSNRGSGQILIDLYLDLRLDRVVPISTGLLSVNVINH